MKKLLFILSAILIAAASGCSQKEQKISKDDLISEKDSVSYAMGTDMGRRLKNQLYELDYDILIKGIQDGYEETALLLTDTEIREILVNARKNFAERKREQQSKIDEEWRQKNLEFLRDNRNRSEVTATGLGLQYEILKEGTGQKPRPEDSVKVKYTGWLYDGKKFDSSDDYGNGDPVTFKLSQLIPGWKRALAMMGEGSKWKLYIHPDLGYGAKDLGKIPPHSVLVFEIELVKVIPAPGTAEQKRKQDA